MRNYNGGSRFQLQTDDGMEPNLTKSKGSGRRIESHHRAFIFSNPGDQTETQRINFHSYFCKRVQSTPPCKALSPQHMTYNKINKGQKSFRNWISIRSSKEEKEHC